MTPMTPHVDVGAYLLGALDDAEMTAFEAHLAECEACGQELDELSGVVPVLAELREDGIGIPEPPGDALLDRLLRQVAAERRTRRRRRLLAVAAAAVLVVGGPTIAVIATQDGGGSSTSASAFPSERHSASNPATGVSAVVGVTDRTWGTAVDLRLSGVRGPLHCHLDAVGPGSTRETVANWSVPAAGYGTGEQPKPLTVHGATSMPKNSISRFEVRTDDGALLVSVPQSGTQPTDRPRGATS
ncbi:Putative zinc-finger [Actinacidiphila yanglinensis]|uniref:Putative zinc-finger n=1 Tax=Actinacidiphila yanglinensis TaxID=310779 RepID=A0A1H5T2S4_9ACTN|nr:zf-HC2 domain-containing protein [Actinacidiphila yanglinensis]SEF57075.1 Putative zinc-finger [Actinacidiphila yanglinensis]